ncbi:MULTISPECIES: AarF/ABC1/UbiB kinase family protein [unclassified Moorena]|uniref:ABC1 kinase family protein n=1 Tax=unclassified Moorena TaxID=2683338 RepID=UPI0014013D80|nr:MULTISPECIES: AarF/ABC1/UbiB kinase family protein [unclassified Moorena]NEO15359.1 AarF/ABC1/UbiB kinase family protein [Moorena sp. SIO3E8]NEO46761.1 AarF/ABC1/UbiB kinase family protein [Moorena sp. SIO4A3]NEQ02565.1 AarF/ABC1/UbiB kinase family protein [Moorena sp. SIO3F7]
MNPKTVSPTSHQALDSEADADKSLVPVSGSNSSVEEELSSTTGSSVLETDKPRYDPSAIAAQYQRAYLLILRRSFTIIWSFISFALGLWWDRFRGRDVTENRARAIQLREILTDLGPAYIKIGQALSTRPDLVPQVFLDELTLLQDQLPPFENEVAYKFIEEELGDRPENIFAELTEKPVAAASLGQVYKGKLKTGETVAVKVQRPGLAHKITLDLYIIRLVAQWVQTNVKRVRSDLVAIMDEFGARIFEEMDYQHEGRNAERFAKLYGKLPEIYVPRIYWDYTGRRVLTMEWITGSKLTDMEKIKAQGIDAKHLIEVGVNCSLRQLLEYGFFHADPHPGNLLATSDGKLAYIDFGMMSQVKTYQRYGLIEAVVHLVNRDFPGLANDYVKLEFLTPDTDLTPIIPALAKVFNNALGASVAELNFKSITDQLSALMYEYPFRVPAYYALIIRSLVTLEGIAINVEPDFKVLSKAYPYVAKRLLTDSSPELRASLRDLLFKDEGFRWNRLENLLRNAGNSPDYDINQVLDQTLDFIFSERGAFIREHLVNEIVKAIDSFGRRTLDNVSYALQERLGLEINNQDNQDKKPEDKPESTENIQRIWQILQDTPGFDLMQLLPVIPQVFLKQETQEMGQKIAGGLAQRVIARMIREALLQDNPDNDTLNGHGQGSNPNLVLPPTAAMR